MRITYIYIFFLVEESRNLGVLVLNEGEDTLEVNVTGGNFLKGLKILKLQTKRVRACNFNLRLFPIWHLAAMCIFGSRVILHRCFSILSF